MSTNVQRLGQMLRDKRAHLRFAELYDRHAYALLDFV